MVPSDTADAVHAIASASRSLAGRPVVVKLGGSAMEDPAATAGMLRAVVTLWTVGVKLVLVHGGGKPIDRAMAAAGLTPKKVAGRRYSDDATLDIVVRVLGEINAGLVAQLRESETDADGFADQMSFPVRGERLTITDNGLPVDLGRVGGPTNVNTDALRERFDRRRAVPVLPSLAVDDAGWLNVNADTAASAVAGALKADACFFLTDTPGVLRDVRNPESLVPKLTATECRGLIADGVIAGGMIPKVEACFEALAAGAGRAVILDGRDPNALLGPFLGVATGTEIRP